ncbi:mechanosensitive ion channel domain-containing protein [Stappia sp. WLB 29]|uniref:mechanosensitive ion channel family protein n=1 Tax=Stappia sp. WLB 29 TaxID=2925220 RepID=UPI0020C004B8|nr:mechanosensitive ion channel domain-containing protein [Stappia sp. WLB 29]
MTFYMERLESLFDRPDVVGIALFAGALLAGLVVQRLVFRSLTYLVSDKDLVWRSIVSRTRRPSQLAVLALALVIASSLAPLSARQADVVQHLLTVCLILLAGWVARTAINIWLVLYLRRFKLDAEDNLLARKHVTQTRILQRVANVLIVAIVVSWVMMTCEPIRQYGVSLLASAGAAGLVAGLALQPVLKNLFAGIQLAITQPIRIDDALLVEGEWGRVEEITSTYVVLKIWDWRRLVLPLSYFIEKPFQNWTRETASLIGSVTIFLDFTIPVQAVREKVEEIAAASPLWDRQVVNVAVVDFREEVMEIRILVSASDAGRAFDLRCEVREKLIDHIRETFPQALPRTRAEVAAVPERRSA